jgi:Ribonuclease G/E
VRALAEWVFERGIGEDRAALIEDDRIVEMHIELPGLRAGSIVEGRLTRILVPGRRGVATLTDGSEVLIEPLPKVSEGAAVRVQIMREFIAEPGAVKRAKGRISDMPLRTGPDLAARIGAHREIGPNDPDDFEAAGWSEWLEAAALGEIEFAEGRLRIAMTPAMTLIDVDGEGAPMSLALAGVQAAASVIRCFGIAGNIGIDLPTVEGRDQRLTIAEAFDAVLPQPFERTVVNGFGFLQVVRPRARASVMEILQIDRAAADARALMRLAQRSGHVGALELDASPAMRRVIDANPDWISALSRQLGGPVTFA